MSTSLLKYSEKTVNIKKDISEKKELRITKKNTLNVELQTPKYGNHQTKHLSVSRRYRKYTESVRLLTISGNAQIKCYMRYKHVIATALKLETVEVNQSKVKLLRQKSFNQTVV
jgi:hypothetical protein